MGANEWHSVHQAESDDSANEMENKFPEWNDCSVGSNFHVGGKLIWDIEWSRRGGEELQPWTV